MNSCGCWKPSSWSISLHCSVEKQVSSWFVICVLVFIMFKPRYSDIRYSPKICKYLLRACKYLLKKQPQIFLAIFSGSFYFIHLIYSKVKLIIVYSKKSSFYIFHSLFSSYLESRTKTSEKHLFVFFLLF